MITTAIAVSLIWHVDCRVLENLCFAPIPLQRINFNSHFTHGTVKATSRKLQPEPTSPHTPDPNSALSALN